MEEKSEEFFGWFESQGGVVDARTVGLTAFEETGRGAIALRDIAVDEVLFEIPRPLVLSTRTCTLPQLIGSKDWEPLQKGWAGLILCMMWETAKGSGGKWSGYLSSMPTSFTSLMFWNDQDLLELQGSMVLEKIGKADAEREYSDKIVPILQKRQDLFPDSLHQKYYSLEKFHIHGSRILSRSFHVEPWNEGRDDQDRKAADLSDSHTDAMDVDHDLPHAEIPDANGNGASGVESVQKFGSEMSTNGDEEEMDDSANVGMVPLADLLNARHGHDNARLFYERDSLKMIATKEIKSGTQIWNTYGDPPNSDLLRRYGYVDLVPLPNSGYGNPSDVVEVKADLAIQAIGLGDYKERIDFFLEEGGDDVFVLDTDYDVPEELLALIRLLLLPAEDWSKVRGKGRLPKHKVDLKSLEILEKILRIRMSLYSTDITTDQQLLHQETSINHRNAIIVRLGEKRILQEVLLKVEAEIARHRQANGSQAGKVKKRKPDSKSEGDRKRTKQGF